MSNLIKVNIYVANDPFLSILTDIAIGYFVYNNRKELNETGHLTPKIIVKTNDRRTIVADFSRYPNDPDDKCDFIKSLGIEIARNYGSFSEAVSVSEAWGLFTTPDVDLSNVRVSQHPERREMIVTAGRNVGNTCQNVVVQPFLRQGDSIKWDEPITTMDMSSSGILDCLFDQ